MVSRLAVTLAVALLGAAPAFAGEGRSPQGTVPHSDVVGALPPGSHEGAVDTGDVVYFGRTSVAAATAMRAPDAKAETARHPAAARDCGCHDG